MVSQSTLTFEYNSYGSETIICTVFINEMLDEKVSIYVYELQYLFNYYNITHKY